MSTKCGRSSKNPCVMGFNKKRGLIALQKCLAIGGGHKKICWSEDEDNPRVSIERQYNDGEFVKLHRDGKKASVPRRNPNHGGNGQENVLRSRQVIDSEFVDGSTLIEGLVLVSSGLFLISVVCFWLLSDTGSGFSSCSRCGTCCLVVLSLVTNTLFACGRVGAAIFSRSSV